MGNPSNRTSMRGQLTLRGVVIGVLGCVIITASSAYTALKMGALPWPIVFAAVISLFFLKLMGNASLNEANVTHTIMSAGAMVAGGLAFTIPGAWMLGHADQISWLDMFIVALAGTILGLLATALIHRHFIVDAALEFPTGNAAAQTLRATEAGGKTGKQLFGSMALAGIYSVLRDALGIVPSMLCTLNIPGVTFGIYNSPMLLSVGFLVGFAPVAFWFAGALLGNFGIIVGGTAAGLFDVMTAQGIVKSLGMGLMMGFGVAVVLKDILPQVAGIVRGLAADSSTDTDEQSLISGSLKLDAGRHRRDRRHRARSRSRSGRHRHAVHLCHHHHERSELRPDGHRPHGDLRPHRHAHRGGLRAARPGQAVLYRRHRGRGVRSCGRRHERL